MTHFSRSQTLGQRLTNCFNLFVFLLFWVIWGMQVYLDYYGSRVPHSETGELYSVPLGAATIYVKPWQYWLASTETRIFGIEMMALVILLNRGSSPNKSDRS